MGNVDLQFAAFFGCWIALAIGNFLFFQFNRNASLKKRVLGWDLFFTGALFLGFLAWIGLPAEAFFLVIPALALIAILNYWGTKFCPCCGKTMVNAYRATFCSRCGQPLSQKDSEPPKTA